MITYTDSKRNTGSTTAEDLVPTLLSMYDTLVGRETSHLDRRNNAHQPPPPRPLSVTSIASSSSSSTSSVSSSGSSCKGGRLTKGSAYLASIESLEDSLGEESLDNDHHIQSSRIRPDCPSSLLVNGGCSVVGTNGVGGVVSGVVVGSSTTGCPYGVSISGPCPPLAKPKYCDPNLSYMDRVVMEIVETEAVYVSHLKEVIIGYLERWSNMPEPPLTDKQLSDLFSNLKQIYDFNSCFLRELEGCGLDPVRVARVFVKNNAGFAIYTDYCTNYPRTVSMLTALMADESKVCLFRERQAALRHTLPLGSYLLKPVQRILKYHLLLQNIVKESCPDLEGYQDIVDALSGMTSIARHINDMKRRHEHAVRVQEIQSLLLGWQGEDLTRYGELCAEGTFGLAGAKALRHAFLFDKMLLITKKKEEGILGYKAHIMCSNLMLIESVPGEPLSFHVIPFDNPRLQYTLQAKSLEQKREWTLQLKRVILENYNAVIPIHARQLVMQLGQTSYHDEVVSLERSSTKKQHSAPEYLEKRKQERRKSESSGLGARLRSNRAARKTSHLVQSLRSERLLRRGSSQPAKQLSASANPLEESVATRRQSEPTGCFPVGSSNNSETEDRDDRDDPQLRQHSTCNVESRTQQESEPKAKSLEEVVSQLLMQNKEFQRVLSKQRLRRARQETSEDEGDYDNVCLAAAWLNQQAEHLAEPRGKAGSLPRGGFPLAPREARVSPDRPVTIASDKAQDISLEDMERYANTERRLLGRFPLDTENESTPGTSATDLSDPSINHHHEHSHQHNHHPEYKIYRSRSAIRGVLAHVTGRLAALALSQEVDPGDSGGGTCGIKPSSTHSTSSCPIYRQGSSSLGARIAHGNETDYADPRSLFITPSKKAASLLGVRPYSVLSLASESSGYCGSGSSQPDDSTDGYYERSLDALDLHASACRDSAVFSDHEDDVLPAPNAPKKVPPPVPPRPPKNAVPPLASPDPMTDDYDTSSIASTVIDATQPRGGWVRHVIGKIQGNNV